MTETSLLADRDDILFMLHRQFGLTDYTGKRQDWKPFNRKMVDMTLEEVRRFALKEVLPSNEEGDRIGAKFENGKVLLPKSFQKIWNTMADAGFIAMTENLNLGGSGMPNLLATACKLWLTAANFAFMMYPGLACEVGRLIEEHGTEEQVEKYVEKLYTGELGGTMCLTEPQAGSDVGAVETIATKNGDGTYTITGSKIFITNGEHNLTRNIIHPVLARIEGAPAGTKGISLFLVPKQIDGKTNSVKCTGIEEKMGIHGNGTCHMSFDAAIGYLLGKENKGMSIMFSMMNRARHMVAMQGAAAAYAAYMYALGYAQERKQGRALKKYIIWAPPVTIINHPDVRRQLMTMKAYVEGMTSLIFYISYCEDMAVVDSKEPKEKWRGLIDILTPVTKGFCTDHALHICNQAMQVYGGYGYIKEYPVEQLVRDVRITSIYEGTNGIQAMDFVFRQMTNRDNAMRLLAAIDKTVKEAKYESSKGGLAIYSDMAAKLEKLVESFAIAAAESADKDPGAVAAHAHPFMDVAGHILIGWMLLWRSLVGEEKHILTSQFFFNNVLPSIEGKLDSIRDLDVSALSIRFGR